MSVIGINPFASLSLIAAPAVLTNASSVLALGTSNRFARAIDRARLLSSQLIAIGSADDPSYDLKVRQLERVERRSLMLVHALSSFYFSLGSFACAALISLLGASVSASNETLLFKATLIIGLSAGVLGVGGLMIGCGLLVTETRLAIQNLRDESAEVRKITRGLLQSK